MRKVGIRQAQRQLGGLVTEAQEHRILLTRHGKPAVILLGVEGQDLEEVLLAHDPEFIKLIEERQRPGRRLLSFDEVFGGEAGPAGSRSPRPRARRRKTPT